MVTHKKDIPPPIKIAILAMGGEGGGVLADWIVGAAEAQGYVAQATSVPGVAQRTGATLYYVEIVPIARNRLDADPVLSLMPTPGDVDIVVASELMESARAVQRGLVTQDKTWLITSSSRTYALQEKMNMADGRVDAQALRRAGEQAARVYVARDFAQIARDCASVISAALFGALAASGRLPWGRSAFEATIERGGIGVAASLRAFQAGFAAYETPEPVAAAAALPRRDARLDALAARLQAEFPAAVWTTLEHGIAQTADFQGLPYAGLYLDRLRAVAALPVGGVQHAQLLQETGRSLALWMCFEDPARVAEMKLRCSRMERIRQEAKVKEGQLFQVTEFFHPRLEEVADALPPAVARWLMGSTLPRALVSRLTRNGLQIRTRSVHGALLLYAVAWMRHWRPRSARMQRESQAIDQWLQHIHRAAQTDPELACEIAQCQRLIKGYGDTHARGLRSFHRIMAALPQLQAHSAARDVRRLREAALSDETCAALDGLLASVAP